MLRECALFFITVFISPSLIYCQEDFPSELEPIVITKSKFHLLDSYSIESVSLEDFFVISPIEVLGLSPLDLQSRSPRGAIQTDFSLRGSNFQGVLMLIDGQRINDPQTAHHNSDIPITAADIEKIELIPGLSSCRYGPDAIGGAINFQIKNPRERKRLLEFSLAEYQTSYSLLSVTETKDNLGLRISQEIHESGGFYEDTDFKKYTSSLNLFLDTPHGELRFNFGYQEKEFGAYDFYTPGNGYLSKEWTKTFLINTGVDLEKNGFIIKPHLLWRRHFDKFLLDKTLRRSAYLNHHRTDMLTPDIYFQKEITRLGKLGLGLEYGEERINSANLGKHTRQHKSIFMDNTKELNNGLSFDSSFRMDDFEGFDKVYTGSVNSNFMLSEDQTISFGVSRSMRMPSFTELYYSDPVSVGNAGLSAEESINYQLGYNYDKNPISYGGVIFLRKEKEFIDWVKRTPSQTKWQAENITEADVLGIENYLGYQVNNYLKLNANYTYINKYPYEHIHLYKYGANYIKHLTNAIFIFDFPFGVQSLSLTYKKKPNRNGWFLVDIGLSYKLNKNCRIFLKGTNLFNVEYQEIEGIPQPGRWLEAGLSIKW